MASVASKETSYKVGVGFFQVGVHFDETCGEGLTIWHNDFQQGGSSAKLESLAFSVQASCFWDSRP